MNSTRGFALALVLLVLVIGAVLLTAGLFLAVQEHRASGAERRLQHGFLDTEADLAAVLHNRSAAELRLLLPLPLDSSAITGLPGRGTIRRLTPSLYLIETSRESLGVQVRLGMLARARPPAHQTAAALSVGGAAVLAGDARVDGRDSSPPGDVTCTPSDSGVAGLAAGSALVPASASVDGAPPVQLRAGTDSGLAPADADLFGRLAAQATVSVPGGVWHPGPATVGTACDLRDSANWGAPFGPPSPCAGYFPTIHVTGDVDITGGEGQGILLVDGDLRFSGGFVFHGLLLTRGKIEVAPLSGRLLVVGMVAAASAGTPSAPLGSFTARYSKCMVSHSLLSAGRLVPLRSRGWKQLF